MDKFSDAPMFPSSKLGAHRIKTSERKAFVEWISLPRSEREPATMKAWAELHHVALSTVQRWKTDTRVYAEAAERLGRHIDIEVMPGAIAALSKTAQDPKNRQHVAASRVLIDYLKWHVARTSDDQSDISKLTDEELRELLVSALDELDERSPA